MFSLTSTSPDRQGTLGSYLFLKILTAYITALFNGRIVGTLSIIKLVFTVSQSGIGIYCLDSIQLELQAPN